MWSALFVSPNFLERVAEPESPFHPVYLTYRRAEITRAELLHPIDGWHASVEGHNALADAAFSNLKLSLDFLGISDSRRGGFQSPLLGRRTRDRRSLATNRRVVSGARLFLASCDSRNVLVARVTVPSHAMFGGSLRFPKVEQSNRIPR
jgi:hypothetical protein